MGLRGRDRRGRGADPVIGKFAFLFSLALAAGTALPSLTPLAARDYGVEGEAWPIIEPDLLETIKAKLLAMQKSGEIDRMNRELVERSTARVRRPVPVSGMSPATEERSWDFNPSIIVDRDIRDQKGNLIAAQGTRVNPLDMVGMAKEFIFLDGDSPDEVAWSMAQGGDTKAMLILVSGSPFDLMKDRQRRFFFDQSGVLTTKFGIVHTPAIVRQRGNVLEVREVVIKRGRNEA